MMSLHFRLHSAVVSFTISAIFGVSIFTYLVVKDQRNIARSSLTNGFLLNSLDQENLILNGRSYDFPGDITRIKRDFMFASGQNETDPQCFQHCNDDWKTEFEQVFNISCKDFYDFPFHPKILDYAGYLSYCELAEKQTKCFMQQCGDQNANRVFSPSNFLCMFKRTMFLTARQCLEDAEPLNFLKCDQHCHQMALKNVAAEKKHKIRANLGKVFSDSELDRYESELDLLCTFQQCYQDCHRDIIRNACPSALADVAIELVHSYIQWHAADIYDWHVLSENMDKLPQSCSHLTGYNPDEDPILKIISNLS